MLSKCMLTPLKLARLLEWNARLGKSSAIMAVDITNHQVGVALARHLPADPGYATPEDCHDRSLHRNSGDDNDDGAPCIRIEPLPSIPYMSHAAERPSRLQRADRTAKVCSELQQLAQRHRVKGLLIRWPGDVDEEWITQIHEGRLSNTASSNGVLPADETKQTKEIHAHSGDLDALINEGTMGYRRGRILYFLDKCHTGIEKSLDNKSTDGRATESGAFLKEGSRPFALWDTTCAENQLCNTPIDLNNPHSQHCQHPQVTNDSNHYKTPSIFPTNRADKYGNSLTAMDRWGRAPIFGMPPTDLLKRYQHRTGIFHYSSKHPFPYHLGDGSQSEQNRDNPNNVDGYVSETKQSQLNCPTDKMQGSLNAMCTLQEFAAMHLDGNIVLPSWMKDDASSSTSQTYLTEKDRITNELTDRTTSRTTDELKDTLTNRTTGSAKNLKLTGKSDTTTLVPMEKEPFPFQNNADLISHALREVPLGYSNGTLFDISAKDARTGNSLKNGLVQVPLRAARKKVIPKGTLICQGR